MFGVFRIQHLPEVMSEIEDYLVKVTRWGRASCPYFRDRQRLFPRGAVPSSVSGVRVCSDVRIGQDFRPTRNRMIKKRFTLR